MGKIVSIGIVCMMIMGSLLSVSFFSDSVNALNWDSEQVDFEYNVELMQELKSKHEKQKIQNQSKRIAKRIKKDPKYYRKYVE